jgi:hypothetical protein
MRGRGSSDVVLPHPIDSGRLASVLALEAFTQPLRFAEQPHQGREPRPRLFTCHPCETLEFGCHGQSPLGVGPCLALALSQTATPLLGPRYQASSLLWVAPTSKHRRPCSRCLGLFTGARLRRTDARISLVTTYSPCQARHGLGPRGVSSALALRAGSIVACRKDKPVGTLQLTFRGSIPSRSAPPVTFSPRLLSCLRIDGPVTTRAARLDTGLVASDYPGGIPTR